MFNTMRRIPATAVAVAATVAITGVTSATAASLVTGAQIKNGTVTGLDLKNGSVSGLDVRNASVTGTDVKNRSLTTADLSAGTIAALKGAPGPQGAQGPKGDPGAPAGPAAVLSATQAVSKTVDELGEQILTLDVPAGKFLIQAKAQIDNADATGQEGKCDLKNGNVELDEGVESIVDNRGGTPALLAVVTLPVAATITLTCEGDNVANDELVARKGKIVATPVS